MRLSNLFGDVLSRSFNVIGQLMKKCWLLLFSIKAVIGQFSSKWPDPNICTIKCWPTKNDATVAVSQQKLCCFFIE